MTQPLLEVRSLDVNTPEGRPLLRGLNLSLGAERVAVVGRNGVGKSTLLTALAGEVVDPRVTVRGTVRRVPQLLDPRAAADAWSRAHDLADAVGPAWWREAAALGLPTRPLVDGASRGEHRKLELMAAFLAGPDLLLLDEPTEDLDAAGLAWLLQRVRAWRGGLVVVSHHRELLAAFEHFFVVAESGCRYLPGRYDDVRARLDAEHAAREERYARRLGGLDDDEHHDHTVRRRRQRKRAVGRLHELDRSQSRMRLNSRRGAAQVSQGRQAEVRDARIEARRSEVRSIRRALTVQLPLDVVVPAPTVGAGDVIVMQGVTLEAGSRVLVRGLDLCVRHERVAVVGPNGAGKTTLLTAALGARAPSCGQVRVDAARVGAIGQGAAEWRVDASLLTLLEAGSDAPLDAIVQVLAAHRFPLALAERPLRSLSPGERIRAALICVLRRRPVVDVLVLDEPTAGLDLVGEAALTAALKAWKGGLLVASHDLEFLRGVGVDRWVTLGA